MKVKILQRLKDLPEVPKHLKGYSPMYPIAVEEIHQLGEGGGMESSDGSDDGSDGEMSADFYRGYKEAMNHAHQHLPKKPWWKVWG